MTLNDNPMVSAEKRRKLLLVRRSKLLAYQSLRIEIVYENGVAARMLINPYIKTEKASKIIRIIDKELSSIDKTLKHFK
jgi:hypothetical protein